MSASKAGVGPLALAAECKRIVVVAALVRCAAGTAITVGTRKQASKKVPGIQPWRTCFGDGDEGELKRII
jgi:hypothetical protein